MKNNDNLTVKSDTNEQKARETVKNNRIFAGACGVYAFRAAPCVSVLAAVCGGLLLCGTLSCSTSPKRAMQYTETRDAAVLALEQSSSFAFAGKYSEARERLDSAYKLAVSVDSPDVIISVCLARVSLELSDESQVSAAAAAAPAAAEKTKTPRARTAQERADEACRYLERAKELVPYSSNSAKNNALCAVSEVRMSAAFKKDSSFNKEIAQLDEVIPVFAKDPFNTASVLMLKGDLFRLQKQYSQAETYYTQAAQMFTSKRYLNEIGLAWYKTAQVRSLAGSKDSAVAALENAIKFDRDAENTRALGIDYYMCGVLLSRSPSSEADKKRAQFCLNHSAEILDSAGFADLAQRSRQKAAEIK